MKYFVYCRKSSEAEDRQVLSIESQLSELRRAFDARPEIEIIGVYEEAYSAKSPGRRLFNEMIARIERGEAQGIAAWAPDRLARNSIDGGRIVYLIDRGVLQDLKFSTYTFENNSQGKFMLQIMFGQSKYYSDALSENVKRGNRTKLEKGWRPNQAPLGYLNDSATKTITKDPIHFPLIRKMYDLMLSGSYTPREIARIARDDWGFRTPKRRRIGGGPLAMSSIYKILSNPFYAGVIHWNGQVYAGKHEAAVTPHEFRRVRQLLKQPGGPRPQRRTFAFTGMIHCGTCGLMVTAEYKVNRYGHRYVYYHCSKGRRSPRCSEPSVELHSLERQIVEFLRTLKIDPAIESWALAELTHEGCVTLEHEEARKLSLARTADELGKQIDELTGLRIRMLITDREFLERRSRLQQEQLHYRKKASVDPAADNWFEPVGEIISFSNRAAEWFLSGDDTAKRIILGSVGSNLALRAKIINIEAKKPFVTVSGLGSRPNQLGVVDDLRTNHTKSDKLRRVLRKIGQSLDSDEGHEIVENIRKLRERFEPEVLAKQDAERARRAKRVRAIDRGSRGGWPFPPPLHS